MDKVIMSGLFGAFAGAIGFAMAKRIHGADIGEKCYPIYSLSLFGMCHTVAFFI